MSTDVHYSIFRTGSQHLRGLRLSDDDMKAISRVIRTHVDSLDRHDDPRWWELASELELLTRDDD